MKETLALFSLVGAVAIAPSATAQAPGPAAPPEAAKAPGVENAPKDKMSPTLEVYLTAMPFVEFVDPTTPTERNAVVTPGHIGTSQVSYTGIDGPRRFRMTGGTSHFGVRGTLPFHPQFKIIGQLETALPLDGNPNPWEAAVPNRNTYLGFAGDWGTLAFGLLDTPYKWLALTTVNPIKAGYVADYSPIIGTPGFVVTGINSAQSFTGSGPSNTAFDRREPNSLQYWSPTLAGLYARAGVSINENRQAEERDPTLVTPINPGGLLSSETNPYIVSIGGGFDLDKLLPECAFCALRLRYAWESHHDYFGLSYLTLVEAPGVDIQRANDWGNRAIVEYSLPIVEDFKTRVLGMGEHLKYTLNMLPHNPVAVAGRVNMYQRLAFYALLEQTIYQHHVWGAYGRAFAGTCTRTPNIDGTPAPCSTADLGAQYLMAGYMYALSEKAQAFVMGYRLSNERSALYVTTPALPREGLSPGYDQTGVGVGFYYSFGADVLN
jgi:predicted porin